MLSATLYQRILGEHFSGLPPMLQQFHGQVEGGCAEGTVTVERGCGLLRRGLAALLRLPPPGHLPLRLEVVVEGKRERWIRHFGDYCLDTLQWQEGSLLIEKAGPVQFGFRLTVENSALAFRQEFCRLWGLRLPSALTLIIGAWACAQGEGWQIKVVICAPLLGVITTYRGELIPE